MTESRAMSTEMTSAVITMPGSSRRNDLCFGLARRVRTAVEREAGAGGTAGWVPVAAADGSTGRSAGFAPRSRRAT